MITKVEFPVSVVYALPERQVEVQLTSDGNMTAREAALRSGLSVYFPHINLASIPLGVFGEHVQDDYVLDKGDRVELHRDLIHDPKELRRNRAKTG